MNEKFLNEDRTRELWTAIKTALAGKLDLDALDEYATTEAVATAIATALIGYAKSDAVTEEITQKITEALADYITQTQMDSAIAEAIGKVSQISIAVEDELPQTGEEKVIYFIPSTTSTEKNIKDEYMWVDGKYELIGSTAIDLTQYWSKDELKIMTSEELQEILK